jgi:hypothetical protein
VITYLVGSSEFDHVACYVTSSVETSEFVGDLDPGAPLFPVEVLAIDYDRFPLLRYVDKYTWAFNDS